MLIGHVLLLTCIWTQFLFLLLLNVGFVTVCMFVLLLDCCAHVDVLVIISVYAGIIVNHSNVIILAIRSA